jgi:hypothetical protein
MTPGERLAIAAHLHVLLRRKTGRVTDPEWMAANVEYATEIVRFTRGKAREDGHTDLAIWADKLEAAMAEPMKAPRQPLAQVLRERAAASAPAPLAAWSESLRPAAPAQAPVPAQASAPLGDHQRGAVGVAAGDGGHHAGVHHPQPANAHAAHRRAATGCRPPPWRRRRAHAAGAHRVEDGGADVAGQARQLVVGLELHAGLHSWGWYFASAGWAAMRRVSRRRVGGHLAVGFGVRVVGRMAGASSKRGLRDAHRAAATWG